MSLPDSLAGAGVIPCAADPVGPHAGLLTRVTGVGEALRGAFDTLHASVFEAPLGPKRSAEHLGEPVPMASRLLRALDASGPVECVLRIPGPDPLQRWVRAARRRGADPAAVRQALRAVEEFEGLIAEEAGDRARLDALLSHWVPDVRRALELRRRQAIYRGQSELKGVSSELELSTILLHPSADGRSVDLCSIQAEVGVVVLRPGLRLRFATERDLRYTPEFAPTCLDGRPSLGSLDGVRLDEFCPGLPARLHADRIGDRVQYSFEVDGVGPKRPGGVIIAEVDRAAFPSGSSEKASYFFLLHRQPARRMILDVILHRDLVPTACPEILVHECIGDGPAAPSDPLRKRDLMSVDVDLREYTSPLEELEAPALPRYRELLAHATGKLGWTEGMTRAYRAELEYPTLGTQLTIRFQPSPFGGPSGRS